jgi:gliding motility-associated-like protein
MDKVFTSLLAGLLFCVVSMSAQQPTFTISPTSNDVQPDDIFEVDITVSDFEDILSMQYGVTWDSTIIEFQQVKNVNSTIPGFSLSGAFSTPNPGGSSNVPANGMGVSWFHPSFITLDLPDGTVLFTLEFQAIGCGTSDIQFSGPPTPGIEVLNGSFTNVGLNPENATATVSGGNCGTVTPETTFSINNITLDVGGTGCVEIEVEDFENITDVAFSITYNASLLNFSSVGGFGLTGLDASDFNTTTPGVITLDWSNATGISLIDGAAIFELCFTGAQAGTANLAFSDNPVSIAVENGDGEAVDFIGQNGAVVVQDVQVTLDLTNTTVDVGQTGCVDVRVSDFDNIGDLQLTINYNAALLDFSSVTGINLPGLQASDFNTSTPGVITLSWSNGTGVTEPDGTTIFELCFTGSAAGNASLSFGGASSAETANGTPIDFNGQGGTINVNAVNTDLTLTVEDATVNQGDNVCLALEIDNFEDLIGMSFTVSYNASQLSYTGVSNLNGNLPGFSVAGNIANPSPGFVTINWFENSLTPITLPDGSILLEVCFDAIGSGTTDVEITSDVAAIEFSDINENVIPLVANDGTVTINGGPPPTGDLTLTVEDATVNQGDNVCLALEIDNFEDLIGMSFTVSYNASQLSYTGVSNLNGNLPGFSVAGNIANPSPGFVTINWFENSLTPITLPDGSILLEVCFDAIGSGTTDVEITSDVAAIEFSDINENVIPLVANDGTVTINGGPPSNDLTVTVGSTSANQGQTVCVPVTVDNFTDLIGMSFTISYDESLLTYTNVQNLTSNLPGFSVAGNIGNPGPGQVTVNWFENSLTPTSLPNGTVLFEVCFEALGGGSAGVDITSEVAAIEFSDADENVIPPVINNGTITISGDPTPTGLFLTIDDQTVDPGDQFCTSVKAFNFEGVVGMSFTISYNPSVLTLDDITSLTSNLPGFSEAANIGTPSAGFITVNWFENSLTPMDLPDGEVLFDICFTATGSGITSDIEFTSDVAAIEFSDENEDIIPFDSDPGTITFTGVTTDLTLTAGSIDVEPAESFCVPVTVQNFEDIVGMSFTLNYDATHLSFDQVTNLTTNLTGFTTAGNIGNPSAGFITVNWFENSLIPTSLPDNEVLFEVCFTALGVDGSCSDLEFTSDVAAIEFSDADENVIPAFFEDGTVCIEDSVPGQVQVEVGDASVDLDAAVCVPVSVDAFTDITDFGFTLEYDANELQFDNLDAITSMLPNFTGANINTSTPGIISVSWSGGAATLANGTVLFDLCFTAIGTEDACSDIDITGSAEPINFTSSTLGSLSFSGEEGTICINSAFDGFRLSIPDQTVQPGDQVCVPVNVLNFLDVVGFAFTINYDQTQLSFQNISSLNPVIPDFSLAGNFGTPTQIGAGNISVNWFSQSITPVDLPNGAALFEICFTAIGDDGDMSDITFSSSVTPIEISDSNGDVIPFNSLPGTITISAVQPPSIAQVNITDVDCFGENTGAIALTVNGGTGGPYSYNWNNNATTATINNLAAGNYTVTVTDMGSGGLTATATYTVDGPSSAVALSGGVTAPTCLNGTNGAINLNISGGNPGYTISWDSGIQSGQTNPSNLPGGTYCVTVTDENGCTAENCYNVPNGTGQGGTINSTVEDESCAGENDGSIALSVSGAVGTANYFWSTAPGVPGSSTLNNLSPGTYSVTVLDDASCQSTASFQVDDASPINLLEGVTDVSCAGEATGVINLAVSGGNGGFTYSWSGPNNFSSNQSLVANLVAGQYTVTVTDVNDCTASEVYTINEPNAALAVQTIDATPIDQGLDGAVDLQVNGGTMPYTYSWTGPGNFNSSASSLVNLNEQGEYCVTITDANDCTTTACVAVEQVLRINSNITDACFGEATGTIELSADGGMPPYTYAWTGTTATGAIATGLTAGSYSVTVTDSNNETASMTFIVDESPEINFNPTLIPVTGASTNTNGSITLNASGGTSPLTYEWSGPNGFSANDPSVSNLGTGEYCVTITDNNFNNSCSKDTCFNVYFADPMGAPEVTAVGTTCSYTEDGSLEIQINGGVPNFTIEVTDSEGQVTPYTATDNTFTVNDLPPGSTMIVITDLLGSETTTTISIPSPAQLQVTAPDYRHATEGNCNGQISVSISGGTPQYTVNWNNGSIGASIGGLCADQWYVPTVTDANGCIIEVDSIFINNFDVQVGDVEFTSCPDDTNGAIDIDVVGGDPNYTFVWNDANGNQVSNLEDPTGLIAGTYTLIITEASGNMLTRQVVIETESALAVAITSEENYNGFDVSCPDAADGALSATATGSSGYLYEWTNVETSMLVGTGQNIEDLPAGTYQLMVQDEVGCTSTNQIELTAPDTIEVEAFIQDVLCHDGRNGAITANVDGGIEPLDYFWSNGGFGNRITQLEPAAYSVTILDGNNCQQTATFEVENPAPITVTFETEPATEGCNGSVEVIVDGGTGPYTFNWGQSDLQDAELLDLCFGEYFLQVRDRNGCLSENTSVRVEDRRFPCFSDRIILTPDNDGANEEFIILCVNEFPDNHLQIFNRWGQLVFEANNYDNTWNGVTQDGAPLPEGPYYYVLDYTDPEGNPRQQRGSLTILRED